ncbi:hypothetical protein MMPV_009372 [Pyropia vietnamensis]
MRPRRVRRWFLWRHSTLPRVATSAAATGTTAAVAVAAAVAVTVTVAVAVASAAIASTAFVGGVAATADPPPACAPVSPPPDRGDATMPPAASTATTAVHAATAVDAAVDAAAAAAAAAVATAAAANADVMAADSASYYPPSVRPWASLTSAELAAFLRPTAPAPTVVLLPVSSTEQHGTALPLGTDTAIVTAVLRVALAAAAVAATATDSDGGADAGGVSSSAVAGVSSPAPPPPSPPPSSPSAATGRRESSTTSSTASASAAPVWLLLPPLAVGAAGEHRSFPGTLSLSDTTLAGLYGDVLSSVTAAGASRVVVINGHGGQTANVDLAVRAARFRGGRHGVGHRDGNGDGGGGDVGGSSNRPPPLVVAVHLQGLLSAAAADMVVDGVAGWDAAEASAGIHGGAVEASVMLAVRGAAVLRGGRHHPPGSRAASGGADSGVTEFPPALARCTAAGLCAVGGVGAYGWRAEDLHPSGAVGDVASASAAAGIELLRRVGGQLAVLLGGVAAADVAELLPGG